MTFDAVKPGDTFVFGEGLGKRVREVKEVVGIMLNGATVVRADNGQMFFLDNKEMVK